MRIVLFIKSFLILENHLNIYYNNPNMLMRNTSLKQSSKRKADAGKALWLNERFSSSEWR